jgi:hypothetical protein
VKISLGSRTRTVVRPCYRAAPWLSSEHWTSGSRELDRPAFPVRRVVAGANWRRGRPGSPVSRHAGSLGVMAKPLTADEILPLVKHLTLSERARLVRLITASSEEDATAYRAMPPKADEFANDHDLLEWDAEGWQNVS